MAFCKTCKQEKSIFDMVEVGAADTDICVECSRLTSEKEAAATRQRRREAEERLRRQGRE